MSFRLRITDMQMVLLSWQEMSGGRLKPCSCAQQSVYLQRQAGNSIT